MLNYIWAGLIVLSLVFALVIDVKDLANNTYRNGQELPVTLKFASPPSPRARINDVTIAIDSVAYHRFYATSEAVDTAYTGTLARVGGEYLLRFAADASLPERLTTIKGFSASRDEELQAHVTRLSLSPDGMLARASLRFEPVRFVKIHDMTQAALDMAQSAAEIALGLIGVLALFLGLLQIAEASGIVHALVRVTQPIFRPLFPEIPKDHPALGMIVLNLTANMLGLGNAATPLGLKAMEELQKLNPKKDTATNSMVMLLALNTASIQIVPPVLLVALMGLEVNKLLFPIIIVTFLGAVVAVISARGLGRMARFRKTDPMLTTKPLPETQTGEEG